MSFDIIKTISINKAGKCFITSACNNLYPHRFEKHECKSISNMKTLEDKIKAILLDFENGNFQGGSSKFLKAVEFAQSLPEYDQYCWRINNTRDEEALKDFLYRIYCNMPVQGNFILARKSGLNPDYDLYVRKETKRSVIYTYDKALAKVYKYRHEVESKLKYSFLSDFKVIELVSDKENLNTYNVCIEFKDENQANVEYQQKFKSTKRAMSAISKKYKDWKRISINKVET